MKDRKLFDVYSLAMGNRGKIAQLVMITTAGVKQELNQQSRFIMIIFYVNQWLMTRE
jgi:hypothetical protein